MKKTIRSISTLLLAGLAMQGMAGTVTIVGNGAGGGPIFVSSSLGSINLGTRLRVGTFTDLTILNSTIASFTATNNAASYAATFAALESNFVDLGTGVSNYGSPNQTTGTNSPTQVLFNTTAALSINGAATNNYTVFTGSITNVTYSAGIGASKNLYIWAAANNEIAIVRNANGSGTSAWITPTSDLSGVTLNLSGLQLSAGGAMESSEVLLGKVYDYSSGSDLIALIPEPSISSLLVLGSSAFLAVRRFRKKNSDST